MKNDSICASSATSSGSVRSLPSSCRHLFDAAAELVALIAQASSAPSRRIAWAMPQAIERLLASPTMTARLPARNPIKRAPAPSAALLEDVDEHHEPLAGLEVLRGVHFVPLEEVGHRHAEAARDRRQRVAAAHDVGNLTDAESLPARRTLRLPSVR